MAKRRNKKAAAQIRLLEASGIRAALEEAQQGVCAICKRPPATRRLHLDHDHRTGRARGLLCFRHNRALPNWITPAELRLLADYLEHPPVEELEIEHPGESDRTDG